MAGASDLVVEPMRVLGHEDDKIMFEQPSIMSSFAIPGMEIKPIGDNWIKHGQVLNFSGFEVEIRHCPGHCREM